MMRRVICLTAVALSLAVPVPVRSQPPDLNAVLTDLDGWRFDERFASISQQTAHVRGSSTGLLFEYTRNSKLLFGEDGKLNNAAYRPVATKAVPGLDLSAYDRLSFWIYVEGNAEEAFQWGFTSLRPFRLSCRRGEWFHAQWNLRESRADLTNIQQIIFRGVNQGSALGDPTRAKVYLSDFRLEETAPKEHVGWAPDPDEIVLSYVGVRPGQTVVALLAAEHASKPYALSGGDSRDASLVSGAEQTRRTSYAEAPFIAPAKPGDYRLEIEGGPSTTVRVREHPYEEAIGKALRAIRAQRCGCASELHGPCHLDDAVRADTREPVDLSGGWHDEGVAQFTHLTVLTTANLARLRRSHARAYRLGLNEGADDDLLAEVEWGVRSLLKYELAPGVHYHSLVAPFWYHTDNQPGTGDERKVNVFHPHQLSCWWRAEAAALAASVCREPLRSRAREFAERCWALHLKVKQSYPQDDQARWEADAKNLRVTASHVGASVAMFRLTGEAKYANDAARMGDYLLRFQQDGPTAVGGLSGYFHATLGQPEPYTGVNGKSQDLPGQPLAELLRALPDHASAPKWREALVRYAEGTLKPLGRLNAPYGCIAAGPFSKPQTTLFDGENRGDQVVYPLHFVSQVRGEAEMLRHNVAPSQLNLATQMGAVGTALNDDELINMAHAAVRYVLGANPFHVSLMRNLGARYPVNAQLPNVPGMIVGWMGITSDGLPFFDPHGAGRLHGPDRFSVREGNTAMCGFLLEACACLEDGG